MKHLPDNCSLGNHGFSPACGLHMSPSQISQTNIAHINASIDKGDSSKYNLLRNHTGAAACAIAVFAQAFAQQTIRGSCAATTKHQHQILNSLPSLLGFSLASDAVVFWLFLVFAYSSRMPNEHFPPNRIVSIFSAVIGHSSASSHVVTMWGDSPGLRKTWFWSPRGCRV